MRTPETFILEHAQKPYDPVKAHDYYIRTRKLKGRRKGSTPAPASTQGGQRGSVGRPRMATAPQVTITSQRQAEVKARVEQLQAKLNILNAILKKLIKDAQGDKPATKKSTKTTKSKSVATKKSSAADRKPLTVAQKQEAAKKQRIRYKKTHPNAGKTTSKERQAKIEEVRKQIEQVKAELKAAIAKARETARGSK